MSKILVTGASGQLGSELRVLSEGHSDQFIFTDRAELDITDREAVVSFFKQNTLDVLINCAAYTAVDKAESEEVLADFVNHKAVGYLAEACKKHNIKMIHISTDYVFNGKHYKPYKPNHPVDPVNIYGRTKLAGEQVMKEINPLNSIILRTSWVYSSFGNNFVKTMLRLGKERESLNVIVDQVGTPTYARDLAGAVLKIIPQLNNDKINTYHYSNEGVCSWYDFAKEIMDITGLDCKVNAIPTEQYPTPAPRPYYSVLCKDDIKNQFNLVIPHWKEALKACLRGIKEIANH
ncbi:dTDP-4-dehydrorhamnose reductase [Zhouia amylolytica]|uniref:dTDP-4-dehydrorhamnose reductase n=1 Tax=Zhouia amylolytica AD3 TaxID=1286632 RepID=W2UP87_9FLAO|nr:dTDP-4-dehydrorhamnose reductase [Zhouia amylolytica]ETN95798.1 dtdp-4-dehydrorhamnose reductase [Zhouia amylolytica AD3]